MYVPGPDSVGSIDCLNRDYWIRRYRFYVVFELRSTCFSVSLEKIFIVRRIIKYLIELISLSSRTLKNRFHKLSDNESSRLAPLTSLTCIAIRYICSINLYL